MLTALNIKIFLKIVLSLTIFAILTTLTTLIFNTDSFIIDFTDYVDMKGYYRERSLVASDLRSETKGSRFESGW